MLNLLPVRPKFKIRVHLLLNTVSSDTGAKATHYIIYTVGPAVCQHVAHGVLKNHVRLWLDANKAK